MRARMYPRVAQYAISCPSGRTLVRTRVGWRGASHRNLSIPPVIQLDLVFHTVYHTSSTGERRLQPDYGPRTPSGGVVGSRGVQLVSVACNSKMHNSFFEVSRIVLRHAFNGAAAPTPRSPLSLA